MIRDYEVMNRTANQRLMHQEASCRAKGKVFEARELELELV